MREVEVFHRAFTHVDGGSTIDLGDLDASTVLPQSTLTALDQLLSSIAASSTTPAYAVRRFSADAGSYACFVVAHQVKDARDRFGTLAHARIARVESGEACLDVDALIDLAQEFASDEIRDARPEDRVARLRELLEVEARMPVTDWSVSPLESLPRDFVRTSVAALLSRVGRNEPLLVHVDSLSSPLELARRLSHAWSILPLDFQKMVSWSLDAQSGVRTQVVFSTSPVAGLPSLPRGVSNLASDYVDWVLDRPADARSFIEAAHAIDLNAFGDELKRARKRSSGDAPMSKKQRSTTGGELEPGLVERLNHQVKVAEESMREYVDKRLQMVSRGDRNIPVAAKSTDLRYALIPAGLALLLLIAYVVYDRWQERDADAQIARLERQVAELSSMMGAPVQPDAVEITTTTTTAAPRDPATIPGGTWGLRFVWVVDNEGKTVANAMATIPEVEKYRATLAADRKLTDEERRTLRALLFEHIASATTTSIVIDGNTKDVSKGAIDAMRKQLGLTVLSNDPASADLQAEAVLRWMVRQ